MQAAFVTSITASHPFRRSSATVHPRPYRPLQHRRPYRYGATTITCASGTNPMNPVNIIMKGKEERFESKTRRGLNIVAAVVLRRVMKVIALVSPLLVCAVFMMVAEKWPFLDGLYFATTVATTVGYGDLHPTWRLTRTFVALYAVFCAARVGQVLASAVDVAARVGVKTCSPDDIYDAEQEGWVRLRNTGFLVVGGFLGGWIFYTFSLELHPLQAAYFVCITASTVGLGDVHPKTEVGKLFATGWLILAAVGFANFLARYSEWRGLVRRRQELSNVVSGQFCSDAFAAMDRDNTGKLEEAEFLGYSLVKIGAAREEEVQYILNRFNEMDKDGSGSLTFDEVKNADSNPGRNEKNGTQKLDDNCKYM